MTKDEVLKLALEALETLMIERGSIYDKAITAINEALAQTEQEPIGQLCEESYGRGQVMWFNKPVDGSYVYTTLPQRTWVGLTDEEIMQCLDQGYGINMRLDGFARIIEAKLKEKNT